MMNTARKWRNALACGAAVMASLVFHSHAEQAQEWPTRVIRIVIPFAAGGATDLMGRILATGMSRKLGQQVIVENKAGAAGQLAVEYVAKSEPDGYTMCLCTGGALVIQPAIDKNLVWDPMRDFLPVSHVANFDNIFVAKKDFPVSTVREFIALAKSKPNGLTSGTPGINGAHHLGAINLYQLAGLELVNVPYKGEAPTLTDLMGGQVDVALVTAIGAEPMIEAGKIKPLAMLTEHRSKRLPNVPTIGEEGFPDAVMFSFVGINVPAGTPPKIVDRLATVIQGLVRDPEIQEQMRAKGAEPVGGSPAEYAALMKSERERWERVVKTLRQDQKK